MCKSSINLPDRGDIISSAFFIVSFIFAVSSCCLSNHFSLLISDYYFYWFFNISCAIHCTVSFYYSIFLYFYIFCLENVSFSHTDAAYTASAWLLTSIIYDIRNCQYAVYMKQFSEAMFDLCACGKIVLVFFGNISTTTTTQ